MDDVYAITLRLDNGKSRYLLFNREPVSSEVVEALEEIIVSIETKVVAIDAQLTTLPDPIPRVRYRHMQTTVANFIGLIEAADDFPTTANPSVRVVVAGFEIGSIGLDKRTVHQI